MSFRLDNKIRRDDSLDADSCLGSSFEDNVNKVTGTKLTGSPLLSTFRRKRILDEKQEKKNLQLLRKNRQIEEPKNQPVKQGRKKQDSGIVVEDDINLLENKLVMSKEEYVNYLTENEVGLQARYNKYLRKQAFYTQNYEITQQYMEQALKIYENPNCVLHYHLDGSLSASLLILLAIIAQPQLITQIRGIKAVNPILFVIALKVIQTKEKNKVDEEIIQHILSELHLKTEKETVYQLIDELMDSYIEEVIKKIKDGYLNISQKDLLACKVDLKKLITLPGFPQFFDEKSAEVYRNRSEKTTIEPYILKKNLQENEYSLEKTQVAIIRLLSSGWYFKGNKPDYSSIAHRTVYNFTYLESVVV